MNGLKTTDTMQKPLNTFRIAWQSALAAGLCLGLPAGLLLWLILFQQIYHSTVVESLIDILQVNDLYTIYIVVISSMMWSYLLGHISGYHQWWRIVTASALGVITAWFLPLDVALRYLKLSKCGQASPVL